MNKLFAAFFICALMMPCANSHSQSKKLTSKPQQNNVTIRGVVTYLFNDYQGYRPDVGANVFICPVPKSRGDTGQSMRVHISMMGYELAKMRQQMSKLTNSESSTDDVANFHKIDLATSRICDSLKESPGCIKIVVDGNGNYSKRVKPGLYIVLVVSKNRTGSTLTECEGMIAIEQVIASSNEEYDVNAEFKP